MVEIRKYQDKDFDDIRRICLLTIAPSLIGQEEYVALQYADYYSICEPDNVFVAVDNNKVVGYCLGSISNKTYNKLYKLEILPKIKAISKEAYKMAKFSMLVNNVMSIFYRSHLHIDIMDGYHNQGIGKRLIMAQLENLKSKGSKGVHLGCDKNNLNAQGFYRHLGFKTFLDTNSGIIFAKRLDK